MMKSDSEDPEAEMCPRKSKEASVAKQRRWKKRAGGDEVRINKTL